MYFSSFLGIIETKPATHEATTYLLVCFSIMGIHPTQKYKWLYICYSIIINLLTTVFITVSFTASYFVESNKNVSYGVFFSSIQAVINVYGCAVKILLLVYYNPKLKTAKIIMDRMDERCQAEDEVNELFNIRRLGRSIVVFYCTAYWSFTSTTYLSALITGEPAYSIHLFIIDWRNSSVEFYAATLIEFILTSWTCWQQVANDSYGTVYVCILRAHVKILMLRIRKMASKRENTANENVEELKMCIKDHKNLIE